LKKRKQNKKTKENKQTGTFPVQKTTNLTSESGIKLNN
jgi:hypothetical protein